jgi:hypothetical protein
MNCLCSLLIRTREFKTHLQLVTKTLFFLNEKHTCSQFVTNRPVYLSKEKRQKRISPTSSSHQQQPVNLFSRIVTPSSADKPFFSSARLRCTTLPLVEPTARYVLTGCGCLTGYFNLQVLTTVAKNTTNTLEQARPRATR